MRPCKLHWTEKAALTLAHVTGYSTPRKEFKRADIPIIRRMMHQDVPISKIIETLGLDMSEGAFRKKCQKLQIKTVRQGTGRW